ncbi:hypothetical protein PILCRDRAFT_828847 [Piloderma croceum F 1598]|uniref:Uncharacterized protein n=1 Tax=Piloderma croceum (strain F 1598) TaxID=765440 RepID=A0A0C3B8S0_PILCF|nr:hypothetical protein PILCRDRAFT_828847 [Piloderma croceum F 1598]
MSNPTVAFMRDYLLLDNASINHVICFVEHECIAAPDNGTIFEDPDTHTLYITARIPHGAKSHLLLRQSPRAVLERFVGSSSDRMAPDWTRWPRPAVEFQQPKANFANLFVHMAMWEENMVQPGLPFRMSQWAWSVLRDGHRHGHRHRHFYIRPDVVVYRNSAIYQLMLSVIYM